MCMDIGPFELIRGDVVTPLDEAASIVQGENGWFIIDLLGKKQPIEGSIAEIDLVNRRILVK